MKTKTMMLILCTVLLGCKKDNNILLNGKLSGCPINTTCYYNYYDNADLTQLPPVAGNFRVFLYKTVNVNLCDATTYLSFKTALSNTEFVINSNQIVAGQNMAYDIVCACCDYEASYRPIGGQIKGKRVDSNHWLINASVILGTSASVPLDTLTVNQSFTLTPLQ